MAYLSTGPSHSNGVARSQHRRHPEAYWRHDILGPAPRAFDKTPLTPLCTEAEEPFSVPLSSKGGFLTTKV